MRYGGSLGPELEGATIHNSRYAPIVVFAYQRHGKLRALLDSVSKCPEAKLSDLHVFVDGARSKEGAQLVAETASVARQESRFRSTSVIQRAANLGLVNSITSGVSEMLRSNDRLIVLEDDLVVSPFFLGFMNDALRIYEAVDEVVSIHGYVYPIDRPLPETFFLRGADCWGWATWRRGWATYRHDASALFREIIETEQVDEFDFGGTYPFTDMLRSQAEGKDDSWAVRWHASAFLAGKLTLYPNTCLVANTGFDGSGIHGKGDARWIGELTDVPIKVIPQAPRESELARHSFERFFKRSQGGLLRRLKRRIRRFWWRLSEGVTE